MNKVPGVFLSAVAALILAGCSNDGPAIEIRPQSISFGAAPAPGTDDTAAAVSAVATSGLAVTYLSKTPLVCSVNSATGAVHGNASGECIIEAGQSGNDRYAPAARKTQHFTFSLTESITFTEFPTLSTFDTATVAATASSGKTVTYRVSPASASVCTVAGGTGVVTALAPGDCTVFAEAGTLQAIQTITVAYPPLETTAPAAPGSVTATLGDTLNTATVSVGSTSSGGSKITGYVVTGTKGASAADNFTATGAASPITVTCPSPSCSGYSFAVAATNADGTSPKSAPADVITAYDVKEIFYEPETQPRNSIFIGSFRFNSTTGTVSDLRGKLSESMTGDKIAYPNDTMTWLPLSHQLSSNPVVLGGVSGRLVTTFMLNSTNTFSTQYGEDGWSPGTGFSQYYGFPGALNPGNGGVGNAYAMIFVNAEDPTAPLTQAQIDKLAYADCAAGGMMSSVCMTGTTEAGYGTVGSMGGYPVSQIITKGIAP
jgi:hypothetical protein